MFFITYPFKGQVHVFAGQVRIVSHLSCRTSAILKYICPLNGADKGFFKKKLTSDIENEVKMTKYDQLFCISQ